MSFNSTNIVLKVSCRIELKVRALIDTIFKEFEEYCVEKGVLKYMSKHDGDVDELYPVETLYPLLVFNEDGTYPVFDVVFNKKDRTCAHVNTIVDTFLTREYIRNKIAKYLVQPIYEKIDEEALGNTGGRYQKRTALEKCVEDLKETDGGNEINKIHFRNIFKNHIFNIKYRSKSEYRSLIDFMINKIYIRWY